MYTTGLHVFLLFTALNISAQQHTIKLTPVVENVFVHTSFKDLQHKPFPSNGLVIETAHGVILVDTPWDLPQTQGLLTWIRKKIKKPVTHCIVTHSHDDRVTGVSILQPKDVKILAFARTAEKMKKEGYPAPDVVLPEDTTMTIDGLAIQTFFPGEGHTADNIVVWLPQQQILFGGCFVKSTESPGLGNIADANLAEWDNSVRRVMEKFQAPRVIVPGHQGWGEIHSLQHTLKLLDEKEAKGN